MPPISGVTYGLSGDIATQHSHDRAVEEAINLVALTGSVYPSEDAFVRKVILQITDRITSFAIHARRTSELKQARGITVVDSRWAVGNISLETDFWNIINKIVHAREIHVATFQHGNEHFTNLGDRIIGYVEVKSDRGDSVKFCPYGLVYAYLSQIMSLAKV